MRRLFVVTLLLVPLAAAPGAPAFRHTTERAPWALTDVARDGQALRLGYLGGGCAGEARAQVTETRRDVSIRLLQPVAVPEGDHEACTADLIYYSVVVPLRAPIAGRRILGHARGSRAEGAAFRLFHLHGQRLIELVPRVVGLRPRDARRLLRLQGIRRVAVRGASGCAGRAQVIAQWPHGHSVRRSGRIGLVVRRACG